MDETTPSQPFSYLAMIAVAGIALVFAVALSVLYAFLSEQIDEPQITGTEQAHEERLRTLNDLSELSGNSISVDERSEILGSLRSSSPEQPGEEGGPVLASQPGEEMEEPSQTEPQQTQQQQQQVTQSPEPSPTPDEQRKLDILQGL